MVFSTLRKVSGIYRVDLAKKSTHVICKLFAFNCFTFYGAAPIPCVWVAILNLPHTVLLDYPNILTWSRLHVVQIIEVLYMCMSENAFTLLCCMGLTVLYCLFVILEQVLVQNGLFPFLLSQVFGVLPDKSSAGEQAECY